MPACGYKNGAVKQSRINTITKVATFNMTDKNKD